jgi:hypothetical protein
VKFRRAMWQSMKWTGAVVTVLLLVMWVGSAWYACLCTNSGFSFVDIDSGGFGIHWTNWWSLKNLEPRTWNAYSKQSSSFHLWFQFVSKPFNRYIQMYSIYIPIWFFALLTAVPTALLFRGDRRRRLRERGNACPKCGYPIGSSPLCTECGKPVRARRIEPTTS